MPTEFDLTCASCGGPLLEQNVPATETSIEGISGAVSVAQCANCGSRYFPETTLDRL